MENIKKIVLYNPSVSSLNMGDHIIFDGVRNQLNCLLDESFIVEISTHLPVSGYLKHTKNFEHKFVCGSNLLRGKMNQFFRQWDIHILNANLVGPCVLVGVGWWQYGDEPNFYTKNLYKKVLSRKHLHSVRDSYTEKQMIKMGFDNVINTGCPTMWDLTPQHCSEIPSKKAKDVVCTITDYNKDIQKDTMMLNILCRNYENVYLWIQGTKDFEYFKELSIEDKNIKIINPNLKAFDSVLSNDVDYVGTRLHAGIRALQKKKRSIIIGIDNRAIEKQKDFNLVCISRNEIETLEAKILSEFFTAIVIPERNIERWKSQFVTDGGSVHV